MRERTNGTRRTSHETVASIDARSAARSTRCDSGRNGSSRLRACVNWRAAPPSSLRPQIARVRQLVDAFNMPVYEGDGFEADDMLGTLARQASEQGIDTWLVTLDSDIVQLVQPNVSVYMYRPYQRDVVHYTSDDDVKEPQEPSFEDDD